MNYDISSSSEAWSGAERRSAGRGDTLIALTRLLEAVRRRAAVEALAVSDGEGFLVAGSGAAELCDELAASAPLLVQGLTANDSEEPYLSQLAGRSSVRQLALSGLTVLLSAHGEQAARGVEEMAAGCERILSRH